MYKKIEFAESTIHNQNVYLDDEFKSFTYFFASSPSANFLANISHNDTAKFVQTKIKSDVLRKTVDKAYSINQISNDILRVYISILLLLLLPYFTYIGIFGHAKNQVTLTLSSIWAYFILLIVFYATNGVFNTGFVCSLPLVLGFLAFNLANSNHSTKALYKHTRYIFCFICAKLIYDVVTILIGGQANAFDYGLSGFIYMNLLKGNNYHVLKIFHLLILTSIAFIIVQLFRMIYFKKSSHNLIPINLNKFIVSFLCSLPVAAGITQIYFLVYKTLNPIDPSTFFMIPSSINLLSINTIFSLTAWAITTCIIVVLRNNVESDYNSILNKIQNNVHELL